MQIPEDIQENVRAVLLSKTDGSGILVSTLLRDYKSLMGRALMYKNLGYQNLEAFIKDLPNVCRLEYSDRDMAYKLFGIAKPSTFVSSFVKKAEGSSSPFSDQGGERNKPRERKGERVKLTTDLNEKWEPNHKGIYSLCFDNKSTGLNKADIALKFAQVGEVEDINIIASGMVFVRYSNEDAAKKAVQMYGDSLGVRRADERRGSKRDHNQTSGGRRRYNDSGTGEIQNKGDFRRKGENYSGASEIQSYGDLRREGERFSGKNEYNHRDRNENNSNQPKINGHRYEDTKNNNDEADADWEDEFSDKPTVKMTESSRMEDNKTSLSGNITVPTVEATRGRSQRGRQNPGAPRRVLHGDSSSPKQTTQASSQITQVYIEIGQMMEQRFAFVDCLSLEDAEQMVQELNNHIHRNRNLLVRLGNKNPAEHHSDAGNLHSEMGQLSINTGPHQAGLKSPQPHQAGLKSPQPHQAGLKSPNAISSHHSPASSVGKGGKPGMSRHLESSVDDEIPPLEELVSPRMPTLERMQTYHGDGTRMPALESMPAYHGVSPKMPALEGMRRIMGMAKECLL